MRRWSVGAAALGALLLLALAGSGISAFTPLTAVSGFSIPTGLVILASGALGALAALAGRPASRPSTARDIGLAAVLPLACGATGLLLLAAAGAGAVPPGRAAVAFALTVLALVAGVRCVERLGAGDQMGVESHWGGLGGGAGGWRLLPPTGLALLALSFGGAALALMASEPTKRPEPAGAVNGNIAASADPRGELRNNADAEPPASPRNTVEPSAGGNSAG